MILIGSNQAFVPPWWGGPIFTFYDVMFSAVSELMVDGLDVSISRKHIILDWYIVSNPWHVPMI